MIGPTARSLETGPATQARRCMLTISDRFGTTMVLFQELAAENQLVASHRLAVCVRKQVVHIYMI